MSTETPPDPQQRDRYIVRFADAGMRAKLKARAALNERTLNAEIMFLLKLGLDAEHKASKHHKR